MNLTIVSFAKGRTGYEEAEAEFVRRLSGHGSVTVEVVKNWKDKDGLPTRLLGNTYPVGLYIDGRSYTSTALAQHVGNLLQRGNSHLPSAAPTACRRCGRPGARTAGPCRVSRSPTGWPRLLLLEALYRSLDILHGGNYHK
jgi:hypothetical protein